MDKEEEVQLEAPKETQVPQIADSTEENKTSKTKHEETEESKDIVQVSEPSLAKAEENEITELDMVIHATEKETSPAETAEENGASLNEETGGGTAEENGASLKEETGAGTAEENDASLKEETGAGTAKENDASLKEETVSGTAEDPVKEVREAELPEPLIAPIEVAETTEPVTEGPSNPSDVPPVSSTIVSENAIASGTQCLEEETKEIKHVVEGSKEVELPGPSVTTPCTESVEEDKGAELVKEEIKEAELADATPVAVSDAKPIAEEDKGVKLVKEEIKEAKLADETPVAVSDAKPIAEPSEETKDAEPDQVEEIKEVELSQETPATELVEETANIKPETMLPEVETEVPKFLDTSLAATGEEENKEAALMKEVNISDLPDSSLAATPVVDAELKTDTKTTEVAAVADVHSENDKTPDEGKVEHADAAESADAESEVTEVLPEKKKNKKPLGDHLAEEKANDSANATKQVSDEKLESEVPESEQLTGAVAPKESTEISARDVSSTDGTVIKSDEKEEDKQAIENAASVVTATEVAHEGHGEKLSEREAVVTEEAAKEEVVSKLTSRSPNNILSKVKHQIVKVKKAIVRRSPSSKNMPVENKDDIKVK